VEFTEETMEAMRAHARQTYPEECCGMVVQRGGKQDVVRVTNVQNELNAKDPEQFPRTAATAYAMRYAEVEPLLESAYRGEIRLLAVYHSHPEHDAYFSEHDRAAAANWIGDPSYAGAVQLVFSVRNGEVVDWKAFRWNAEAGAYVEIELG